MKLVNTQLAKGNRQQGCFRHSDGIIKYGMKLRLLIYSIRQAALTRTSEDAKTPIDFIHKTRSHSLTAAIIQNETREREWRCDTIAIRVHAQLSKTHRIT